MVSDFIDEHDGYLYLSSEQQQQAWKTNPKIAQIARIFLEYGFERDGYQFM